MQPFYHRQRGRHPYEAFKIIMKQLSAAVKLVHSKPEFGLCLFTGASDAHWSVIVTQVPETQRDKDINTQEHEPLFLLSGAFKR